MPFNYLVIRLSFLPLGSNISKTPETVMQIKALITISLQSLTCCMLMNVVQKTKPRILHVFLVFLVLISHMLDPDISLTLPLSVEPPTPGFPH